MARLTNRERLERLVATLPEAERVDVEEWGAIRRSGCGLGRHGWIALDLAARPTRARWDEVSEWIVTSYLLVAPKTLARRVEAELGLGDGAERPFSDGRPSSPARSASTRRRPSSVARG